MTNMLTDFFRRNARLSTLLGSLVTAVMLACAVIPLVRFFEFLQPGWSGAYLVGVTLLISLEAMFSYRGLHGRSFPEADWIKYRLTEWVLILFTLKLIILATRGFAGLGYELAQWERSFFSSFIDAEYGLAVMLAFGSWMLATIFAEYLTLLEEDEYLLLSEGRSEATNMRSDVRSRMAELILVIGGIMIFLTALLRSDMHTSWFTLPALRIGVYNILLYFLLGLVLLGLTHFSILRINWLHEGASLQPGLARRWFWYSLLFLLILALVSAVLPTRYSVGLLSFLGLLLSFLIFILRWIGLIISLPFILILVLFSKLFTSSVAEPETPELPRLGLPPPDLSGPPVPWIEFLKSALFWIFIMTVVFYSIRQYLHDHQEAVNALGRFRVFRWLASLLRSWMGWAGGVSGKVSAAFQAGASRLRRKPLNLELPARPGFLNPRRLPPRQQVIFYYLALLRRAGERGLPRGKGQTPFEYSRQLREKIQSSAIENAGEPADIGEDLAAMTDRFVEARYSLHEITPEHTNLVRQYWERIRRALQRLRE